MKTIGKVRTTPQLVEEKSNSSNLYFPTHRIQCLSNLSQLQQGGSLSGQLASLAAVGDRVRSKRDSLQTKQASEAEKLLHEKDEEIKKMQQMLQQMQAKLQENASAQDTMV